MTPTATKNCSRCGGSGLYLSSTTNGTCYGCDGTGTRVSRRLDNPGQFAKEHRIGSVTVTLFGNLHSGYEVTVADGARRTRTVHADLAEAKAAANAAAKAATR